MATRFIGPAIELNETIQQELCCSIHQGLLSQPMTLPCLHRFCQDCLENWIKNCPLRGSNNVPCPNCNASHPIPSEWKTRWFDRILDAVVRTAQSSETEVNKKIIRFVEESFVQFGRSDQMIKILSIAGIRNEQLKNRFESLVKRLGNSKVITLLHGTTYNNALSISCKGFSIPESFERTDVAEGELKFGKAIYFAHAKKATEYGENTLILTDCLLGHVKEKSTSQLKLTPNVVHKAGYDTIHFYSPEEGTVNQEWAIYRVDQCSPLCIISYEIVDVKAANEKLLIDKVKKMNYDQIDYQVLYRALFGTDNQCKAVLHFLTDTCLHFPKRSTLWHTGRCDHTLQPFFYSKIQINLLVKSLQSSYTDVAWRTCGVLANLAACIVDVRKFLITANVLTKLDELLRRSVEDHDKTCILTVTNLLANIGASEYRKLNDEKPLRDFINENLLDHEDEEIRDAGNRFFCNLIGKGSLTSDWIRAGYHDTAMAPDLGEN